MSKWQTRKDYHVFMEHYFEAATRLLSGEQYAYDDRQGTHYIVYPGRAWFRREALKHRLHEAVHAAMLHYEPTNWQQLLLEWPHKAETDPNRIAYTRDERAGEADRQTVTSIGKYLTRHFQDAPDYFIRDIVAQYTYDGKTTITSELSEMIRAVIEGPGSCMSKDFSIRCDDGVRRHPYAVYDPAYGWAMAVRAEGDEVYGRCLLWHDPDDADTKVFVRSYKREKGACSHSGSDEAIEMWLTTQGYKRSRCWPSGARIEAYPVNGAYLMPYIDGGTQRVLEMGDTLTIDDDGEIDADETGGTSSRYNCTCDDCGARFDDEEGGGWTGRHEDNHVCQTCLDNNYTYATGRRGNEYYVRNDDTVEVDGVYYDMEYLSDNNIVELANGDYAHIDNAVYIDSEDTYYDIDDSDIVYAEDTAQYEMKHDCWQCDATSKWYTDEIDYVEIDGNTYHPDDAPEVAEEETDEGEQA